MKGKSRNTVREAKIGAGEKEKEKGLRMKETTRKDEEGDWG